MKSAECLIDTFDYIFANRLGRNSVPDDERGDLMSSVYDPSQWNRFTLDRRQFLTATAAAVGYCAFEAGAVEPRIRDVRVVTDLPMAEAELKLAYDRSSAFAAELVPQNEPVEIKSFTPFLTKQDEIAAKRSLPNTSCRRHALSIGLEVLRDDEAKLPRLSKDQILAYLKGHFVSLQARIYREPVSRALYLGPRCMAVTRSFKGGELTKEFSPTVAESVKNVRSLGLLVPKSVPQTASNLRMVVLVHKNEMSPKSDKPSLAKTTFEYLFVRGQEAGPDRLALHAFATSHERTKFHWLKSAAAPAIPLDCSVRGAVHFTEYSHAGLYPKAAVTRSSSVASQMTFEWDAIDAHSKDKFGGPAIQHMPQLIDAIVAEELKA